MEIFVAKNNQQLGPFDRATIDQKLASQEIALTDLAWVQGMTNWQALSSILDGSATFANNAAPQRTTIVPILSFLGYGIRAFKQPINFQGRARRMELWSFWTIGTLIGLIFTIAFFSAFDFQNWIAISTQHTQEQLEYVRTNPGATMAPAPLPELSTGVTILAAIWTIFGIYHFVASIALIIRRLHDLAKAEWYIILMLIPIANLFFFIYLAFFNSTPGLNTYGPNPKNE